MVTVVLIGRTYRRTIIPISEACHSGWTAGDMTGIIDPIVRSLKSKNHTDQNKETITVNN